MVFGIYDPPRNDPGVLEWSNLKIGDICDTLDFDYEKFFCGAGTFSLVIPRNSVFADRIYTGCFLIKTAESFGEYDGFIVKNILYENDTLKITGYDLNGLLIDRVTLYSGENGKDIRSGSTEAIVKQYIDHNCVSSADEERNFPRLGIAENKDRGIADDAASPRLECVADVVNDILGAQNMGYRIRPLLNVAGETAALMEFDVYEAVDRTQDQSEHSRVTFAFGLGNIAQMKREIGVTADKNTFYCEIDSGAVQRYYKKCEDVPEDEKIISGYDRREEYLKLGCELGELEVYAEHEIADRYRLTDSLDITAGDPLDYGKVYNVGDIVTVYDRERKLQLNSVISAAKIKRTGTEYTVKITLGDSKPKLLDSYAKKGQATANTVRSNAVSINTGALSEYEYLSDLSVKYNGKTYTIEKDEETGLISKISDSAGNSFAPKINSGITDIALHNAVFWAVAMHSGLKATAPLVLFSGETGKAVYCNGFTGFEIIVNAYQERSGLFVWDMRDGSVSLFLDKSFSISAAEDGGTDALIMRSNNKIDLTEYKTMRLTAIVYQNYPRGLTAKAYFTVGEPAAAQSDIAYDFSEWQTIDITTRFSDDYANPGDFREYKIDISKITGMQYLNFGVYHGIEIWDYSCYLQIKKIELY